jgi:rare lipoprotein A
MPFFELRTVAALLTALLLSACQHAPVPLVDAPAPPYAVPGAPMARAAESPAAPTREAAPTDALVKAPDIAPDTAPAAMEPVVRPQTAAAPSAPLVPGPVDWAPTAATPEVGIASWYGHRFHGRRTASGEPFDMHGFSAAHRQLPLGSYARVHNPANGRLALVRINDRGPFIKGRVIDLSHAAALHLGVTQRPQKVEIYALTPDTVRTSTAPAKARVEPARKSTRRRVRTV